METNIFCLSKDFIGVKVIDSIIRVHGVCVKSFGQVTKKFWNESVKIPSYLPVFLNWGEVVGDDFATVTEPFKVASMSNGGLMLIIRANRACSIEIQHQSIKFLEMTNAYLGENYFSQIKIISIA